LLVGAPAALGVALFDRLLARFPGLSPGGRLLCDLALAGGTLVGSYAGTLNNHVPAAALLIAAGAAVLADRPAIAGAACGFAAAVDLLPGLGMTPFFAWMLVAGRGRIRTRWLRFAVGLTPGLAAALLSDLLVTGTLLPPKLLPGAVDLSVRAGASVAGVLLPESRLYPLEVLGGWHGLFLVSPVLVVGALGLWRAATRPPFASPWLWRALGIGIVAQIVGHALLAGSYGGWAFGFRYLIPVQPLLLFGAPVVLAADWGRKLFALLLPPSLLFAAIGAYNPWPPAYEQRTGGDAVASLVHDPIAGNAAAWCCEHWPGSRLCQGVGERFIAADPGMRRRYLELFFASKGDVEALEALERR